jgi:uncharacterized membrane protein YidH (DUF202 family)
MRNSEFRNEVLGLDPYPEDLKERIRERIIHTRERPLKAWERPFLAFWCMPVGLVLLGVATWGFTRYDTVSHIPGHKFAGLAFCLLFGCGLLVFCSMSLKKGALRLRSTSFAVYAALGFVLFWICTAMITGRHVTSGDVAGLIVVSVCVICTRIESSELHLRERVLRNELALAELSELVRKGNENE